jgi:hypothetical protein
MFDIVVAKTFRPEGISPASETVASGAWEDPMMIGLLWRLRLTNNLRILISLVKQRLMVA